MLHSSRGLVPRLFFDDDEPNPAMLKRRDLFGEYDWIIDDREPPPRKGQADARALDRKDGFAVLDFINGLMAAAGVGKADGLRIERMIHDSPARLQTREEMREWIAKSWLRYQD